jgi:hypothetical protein
MVNMLAIGFKVRWFKFGEVDGFFKGDRNP